MKQIFSRVPKRAASAVVAVAAVAGIARMAGAWSPERPTYTMENPAPHVTFNSMTNNPREGDERAFFEVKDAANTAANGFAHKATVQDGQELLLRVYVHNNAADNLNASGKGVAKNTKVRIHLPTATASALRANAYVSADNAQPKEVADTIDLTGANSSDFSVEYVPGSAVAYNNANPNGAKLADSIVTTGAPLGYEKMDGNLPGCFQYVNVVTIKVKVKAPKYTVTKQVSMADQADATWKKTMNAKSGDTLVWLITFRNTGSTPLTNVKIVDEVPTGLEIVPGTVKLINGNYPNGFVYPASAVQANGRQVNVDIGNYNPGAPGVAYLGFRTKVSAPSAQECGTKQVTNKAFATPTGQGAISDTASVTVDTQKTCTTPEEPEEPAQPTYTCETISVTKLGGRKVRVSVNAPVTNGATVKNYTYDFGDGSTPKVSDKNPEEHEYAADGTYTVRVGVTFRVGNEDKNIASDKCAKPVTFTTPTTPEQPKEEPTPQQVQQPQVLATTTELPKTGVASVAGIFTATSLAGAVAHRVVTARRRS